MPPPGSERRKSLLNVRFDVESEESISESATGESAGTYSPRSVRKVASIRVVDAFGREQLSENLQSDDSNLALSSTPNGPHNKNMVRIVDAMGREVSEVVEAKLDAGNDSILTHDDAVARIKRGIVELAETEGWSDLER